MQVNNISSITFNGKTAQTKNGNEYERSNEGKKIVPLVGTTIVGTGMLLSRKNIKLAYNNLSAAALRAKKPLPKNVVGLTVASFALLVLGSMFVSGMIVDAIINRKRKKDADVFAETGGNLEHTNKGKKIMAPIGLGISAINLISDLKTTRSSAAGLVTSLVLGTASWIGYGAIYDHGVNKFRTKLANKAAQAE